MDNKDILRKQIEAMTKADWTTYKSLLTDNAVYEEECTRLVAKGPDQIAKNAQMWMTAFPDTKATIKEIIATGDAVVAELMWEGTHKGTLSGPMGTIPATNRRGKVAAVIVARIDNGKIRQIHHYFDLMTILAQMGVAPQPSVSP
jgi:steroid delta-isomerase-like uncharacterized protein